MARFRISCHKGWSFYSAADYRAILSGAQVVFRATMTANVDTGTLNGALSRPMHSEARCLPPLIAWSPPRPCGPRTSNSQTMDRERLIIQCCPRHINQVPMMRKDHDLAALGESLECAQDVTRTFIVRSDEDIIEHQRHMRV